jgi:hypothetical protein
MINVFYHLIVPALMGQCVGFVLVSEQQGNIQPPVQGHLVGTLPSG